MATKTADWVRQYMTQLGWALIPIPPGTKGPTRKGWNKPFSDDNRTGYFTDVEQAVQYWRKNPGDGVGLVLGASHVVSLDIDDVECARIALGTYGIDIDELRQQATVCIGNPARFRLLFRAPEVELTRKALTWPGPDGSETDDSGKPKPITVFELRAGPIQDCMPPTVHPDTGLPYRWEKTPREMTPLPDELLAIWINWNEYKRDAENLAPWAEAQFMEPVPEPATRSTTVYDGESPIELYNRSESVESLLSARGYVQRGQRWLAPSSTTGLPGITVRDGKMFSHHASDPLCNGYWNDAFDVMRILDHNGDQARAIETAKQQVGWQDRPKPKAEKKPKLKLVQNDGTDGNAAVAIDIMRDPGNPWSNLGNELMAAMITNANGLPKGNLANVAYVVQNHPAMQGVIAWNSFTNRTMMVKAAPWEHSFEKSREWTTVDDLCCAEWIQRCGIDAKVQTIQQAIERTAHENQIHPVRDYLDSLQWDGEPRISRWLADYLGASDSSEYVAAVGKMWLLSAVARIFQPGCQADSALIFESPQGRGKSTALRILGGDWFTDDLPHVSAGKDAAQATQGAWIIEIAEMNSISKAEVSAIKAYLTRRVDRYRPPYGARFIEAPRQCVFAGTINPDGNGYLRDSENRRYWPVTVKETDRDRLNADRDQLWAEAVVRFRAGDNWYIQDDELATLAREEQSSRREVDEWEELIAKYVTHDVMRERDKVSWYARGGALTTISLSGILTDAIGIDPARWTRFDQMRVTKCCTNLGMTPERSRTGRVFRVPAGFEDRE